MRKKLFKKPSKKFLESFNKKVFESNSKRIIITGHKNPDEDSVSSILSIYYYLTEILKPEKEIKMIISSKKEYDNWNQFKNFEKIEFKKDLFDELEEDDLLIVVDGNEWKRFSSNPEISRFEPNTICIDHHQFEKNKFSLSLINKESTSTAELIYKVFFKKAKLNKELCELLLLGIIGDTGNFLFIDSNSTESLDIGKRLIKEGDIDLQTFHSKFSSISKESIFAMKELIDNTTIIDNLNYPTFLYSYMENKDNLFDETSIKDAKNTYMDFIRKTYGIEWFFIVTPNEKGSSLSFRSMPNSIDVNEVAKSLEVGGGHIRAAGGFIEDSPYEATKIILNQLKKVKLSKNR